MILSDEQLARTKLTLEEFERTYNSLANQSNPLEVVEKNALLSTINELKQDINEYEGAKFQAASFENVVSLRELRKQLILNRIAAGFTQDEFASISGISPVLLNKFEATEYENVSLPFLLKCASNLGRHIASVFDDSNGSATEIYNSKNPDEIPYLNDLPIKELIRNKWISAENAFNELRQMIIDSGSLANSAYHRKTTFGERTAKEAALFAWESKILFEAKKIITDKKLHYVEYNPSWIKELVSLSLSPKGPLLAQELLLKKGIILVIEPHLEKTYLDGAALLTDEGFPVIGLTLRLNRIDNFWFVLLHELGHVYLHLLTNKFPIFLDEEVGSDSSDDFEIEANNFSREQLISTNRWSTCVSPVIPKEDIVLNDAKNLQIHPAIIAGRLQFEKSDYTLLSNMLGHGEVRRIFGIE